VDSTAEGEVGDEAVMSEHETYGHVPEVKMGPGPKKSVVEVSVLSFSADQNTDAIVAADGAKRVYTYHKSHTMNVWDTLVGASCRDCGAYTHFESTELRELLLKPCPYPKTLHGNTVVVKIPDAVNHPAHYGGKDNPYEHIKVVDAWGLNYRLGNATKYICRAGRKPGADSLEDLRKAAFYLTDEIRRLTEGKP
jgi:hypothetical protein